VSTDRSARDDHAAAAAPIFSSLLHLARAHGSASAYSYGSSVDWSLPNSLGIDIEEFGTKLCASHPMLPHAIVAAAVEVARSPDGRNTLRRLEVATGSSCVDLCINTIVHKLTLSNASGIALSVHESGLVMQVCRLLRLMIICEPISCSLVEEVQNEEHFVTTMMRVVDLFLHQQRNLPADDLSRLAIVSECLACSRACISLLPVRRAFAVVQFLNHLFVQVITQSSVVRIVFLAPPPGSGQQRCSEGSRRRYDADGR
jgi:hypothetical protein